MTKSLNIEGLTITRTSGCVIDVYSGDEPRQVQCEITEQGNVLSVQPYTVEQRVWSDKFVTQGLIDIQVNGFAGVDFNSPGLTPACVDHALAHMAASGVTCVLPTLITAFEADLVTNLEELDLAVSRSILGPLMVPGYHIEGPFLSPKEGSAGAHPPEAMGPASKELVESLQRASTRPIMLMTVAPEQEGVIDLIPYLLENNIACAIGHTMATREQISAAIEVGATLSTHLGNGLPHQLNKNENPLFSQLGRDELFASFIADGVHVNPESLQVYLRAKTLAKSIIVTDAVAAAGQGLSNGIYTLGKTKIERHGDGSVRIPGSSYLAGSSATMDQMVRNLIEWYGYSMGEILQISRTNPSGFVRGFEGTLTAGSKADFVVWEREKSQLQVAKTHIGPWIIESEV